MAIRRADQEVVSFNRTPQLDISLVLAGSRHIPGEQGLITRRSPHFLLHYVSKGAGSVQAIEGEGAGTTLALREGDWFLARPGIAIQYQQRADSPWCYQWFAVRGATVESCLRRWGFDDGRMVLSESHREAIEPLLQNLINVMMGNSPSRFLMGTAYVHQLLATQWELNAPREGRGQGEAVGVDARIEQACSFMQQHFDQGIAVSDVADYVGFERSYFSKQFSRVMGMTIKDYLSQVRLAQAQALLRDTELSIEAIGNMVGFEHSRVFWQFFKHHTGETPSRWRKAPEEPLSP